MLAFQVCPRVVGGDIRVVFRIPFLVVGTIYNTVQLTVMHLKNAFQLMSVFLGLDLLAVTRADCGNDIRTNDSSLHEVDPSPEFHAIHTEKTSGQPGLWE